LYSVGDQENNPQSATVRDQERAKIADVIASVVIPLLIERRQLLCAQTPRVQQLGDRVIDGDLGDCTATPRESGLTAGVTALRRRKHAFRMAGI